jgi:hypothetical protein
VTDVEAEEGEVEAEERDGKVEGRREVQCDGGRQENSLGTVPLNSQVLYTNTGWPVRRL